MNIRQLSFAVAMTAAPFVVSAPGAFGQGMDHGAGGQAMMQANEKMMEAMGSTQPSGDTDKDFAMMMIEHHRGAIDMAKVELEHGGDPELRALAEKIVADQAKEIAQMQDWLSRQRQ